MMFSEEYHQVALSFRLQSSDDYQTISATVRTHRNSLFLSYKSCFIVLNLVRQRNSHSRLRSNRCCLRLRTTDHRDGSEVPRDLNLRSGDLSEQRNARRCLASLSGRLRSLPEQVFLLPGSSVQHQLRRKLQNRSKRLLRLHPVVQ